MPVSWLGSDNTPEGRRFRAILAWITLTLALIGLACLGGN